jgi:glycosyltransferase involved in cell wall biosynthesis
VRVVIISKALIVGAYQRKAEEIAKQPGIELSVVVPPYWNEESRRVHLERAYTSGYELIVQPIALSGRFHVHFYPGLRGTLSRLHPQIVHADEEPYNFATLQMMALGNLVGAGTVFFSWQNIFRRYPFPFGAVERLNFALAKHAVVGNADAATILRRKGFRKPLTVIPQFGIDPALFAPLPAAERLGRGGPFRIGYVGRIVEQKGLLHLVRAVAGLEGDWRLSLLGAGPLEGQVRRVAAQLGVAERLEVLPPLPSTEVNRHIAALDALVLPSLTRRNWKEQFGRVLVEAMACAVPVVGSNSGEIPNVVGEGGLVYPEGDDGALREALRRLMTAPQERLRLGRLGHERVLARYTHARLAEEYAGVYRQVSACT